jgi:hypothetical protein
MGKIRSCFYFCLVFFGLVGLAIIAIRRSQSDFSQHQQKKLTHGIWIYDNPEILKRDRMYMCGNTDAGTIMDKLKHLEDFISKRFASQYETTPAMLRFFSPQLGNPDAKNGGIVIKNDYPRWVCEYLGEVLCGNTMTIERDEAVVIYMCTPPESQYWSIAAYNMIRTSNYKLEIPGAELSRPISQHWVKTSGDEVWEKPVLFILSGSARTTEFIKSTAISKGISYEEINIITLPGPETNNLRYRNRNQALL